MTDNIKSLNEAAAKGDYEAFADAMGKLLGLDMIEAAATTAKEAMQQMHETLQLAAKRIDDLTRLNAELQSKVTYLNGLRQWFSPETPPDTERSVLAIDSDQMPVVVWWFNEMEEWQDTNTDVVRDVIAWQDIQQFTVPDEIQRKVAK